jgi:hypothetical protein
MKSDEKFKVSLSSISNPKHRIVLKNTPTVGEAGSANYKSSDLIHAPSSFQIYSNSTARVFNVSAKLTSRTSEEATENARILQLLRSWRLPYFGDTASGAVRDDNFTDTSTAEQYFGSDNILGSPPDVLYFTAYASEDVYAALDFSGNIRRVPVVLTQVSDSYGDEMDYISTTYGEPFPVIMPLDFILSESHSPDELNRFELNDYRNGNLQFF